MFGSCFEGDGREREREREREKEREKVYFFCQHQHQREEGREEGRNTTSNDKEFSEQNLPLTDKEGQRMMRPAAAAARKEDSVVPSDFVVSFPPEHPPWYLAFPTLV